MGVTPTPHNAANRGEIAETVLMPGDPLRAKFIAEQYLDDIVCFNQVRNMLGFTGNYHGRRVSVMGGGMGMPSIGIYSYELYHFYGVENIIRIGSAGAISEQVKVRDLIAGMSASTNSNYAAQYKLPGILAPTADFGLLERAVETARARNLPIHVGNILSSDVFYTEDSADNDAWKSMGVLCVEMEAAALYLNAARAGKKALCLLTISDHLYTGESLSAQERQTSFLDMMEVALSLV